MMPNLWFHRLLSLSSRFSEERPKSSLTLSEAASDVDLPRNSQRVMRATPCWGSWPTAGWSGAVPKTLGPMSDQFIVPWLPNRDDGEGSRGREEGEGEGGEKDKTHREDERNAAANGLGAVQG